MIPFRPFWGRKARRWTSGAGLSHWIDLKMIEKKRLDIKMLCMWLGRWLFLEHEGIASPCFFFGRGVCFSFFVFIENSRPSFYWKFLFYEEGRKEKKKKKGGGRLNKASCLWKECDREKWWWRLVWLVFGVCIQKSKRADALFCGVHSVYICICVC